jgi:2-oxoglutarate dehydrogenase E2 component (dihydrolipoamide succinyltransferase)
MPEVELIMPKMGESITEATILKWLKSEGDTIELDEPVLEIATDKVDSEVPSPVAGVLGKQFFGEDEVVEVGKAIATIITEGADVSPSPAAPVAETSPAAQVAETVVAAQAVAVPAVLDSPAPGRFYSPLVLNIAKSEGIGMDELERIPGSGKEGRVTKKDILSYVNNRSEAPAPVATPASNGVVTPSAAPSAKVEAPKSAPSVQYNSSEVEIIEMDRMRKLIAEHMVMSKQTSPHVTSYVEADVTTMVNWRNKTKGDFKKREGQNITFTPIFVECVAKAIKDFPMVNVSVDGNNIIRHKRINIGMAAALPTGNLIVPVIHDADQKNLLGLTRNVNDLAGRARGNKLGPDDIKGGTFTLTNVGGFGNVMGAPIINQPQAAIMATGTIQKKPVVLETPEGDVIAIRHMMFLSLSYDHRVVDGSLGGSFLRRVADYMEQFDPETIV